MRLGTLDTLGDSEPLKMAMEPDEEEIINFTHEAQRSLEEVAYAIREGTLSQCLSSSGNCAYINITTKEDKKVTVRLSTRGFEVVGHCHDNCDLEEDSTIEAYETVYALLGHISPSYAQSFQEAVSSKLKTEK